MAPDQSSRRRAATLLLALAGGACFSPAGNDTAAATTDAGTTAGTGTSATVTGASTSGTGLTSSTSGVTTTGTATTATPTTTGEASTGTVTGTATATATTDDPAICGNDILESGEQCDDGNIVDGDGCSAACESEAAQPRFIFLTSQKYTGEQVAGLGGAAVHCKTLADSAEALPELNGRQWVAWLSDGNNDAVEEIGNFGGDYILPDEHLVVANGTAGLISGDLLAPIKENEKGVAEASIVPCDQNPDDPVWTGTDFDGTRVFDSHCGNWTTTSGDGLMGVYSATGPTWTKCLPRSCTLTARLYCVEI